VYAAGRLRIKLSLMSGIAAKFKMALEVHGLWAGEQNI